MKTAPKLRATSVIAFTNKTRTRTQTRHELTSDAQQISTFKAISSSRQQQM